MGNDAAGQDGAGADAASQAVTDATQAASNTAPAAQGYGTAAANAALEGSATQGSGTQGAAMQEANSMYTGGVRDEAGAQANALQRQAFVETFNKFIPFINMINPTVGLLTKTATGLVDSTGQPIESDYSINSDGTMKAGFGTSQNGIQFTGGRGKNREARLATGENHINSAVSPTINSMPDQTAEATAKATTTADTELNPEEAAANADTEERAKARQRVGLMQMRRVDPFFLDSLPNIFRSRAY